MRTLSTIAIAALLTFIDAVLIQWAWGFLLVPVFQLPAISLLQAFAALLLIRTLRPSKYSLSKGHQRQED